MQLGRSLGRYDGLVTDLWSTVEGHVQRALSRLEIMASSSAGHASTRDSSFLRYVITGSVSTSSSDDKSFVQGREK